MVDLRVDTVVHLVLPERDRLKQLWLVDHCSHEHLCCRLEIVLMVNHNLSWVDSEQYTHWVEVGEIYSVVILVLNCKQRWVWCWGMAVIDMVAAVML